MIKEIAYRKDGQILNCEYGFHWPMNLYSTGYVMISIKPTRKGNVKVSHTWAATKEELQ